ncbi:hypothetical protein M0811_00345 [Anaeramoeba ignava]|uniref:VWFA domain-containing protein n=1 Tax=Anaeramoeba ignava TaxID=1746090 RepID=A0A9Q0LSD3_ANAIG|nr:hypothetical protein M0811_00345 [Anaeramoeba ignava]
MFKFASKFAYQNRRRQKKVNFRRVEEISTNVISLSFESLEDRAFDTDQHIPYECKCGACLNSFSILEPKEEKSEKQVWVCEFCGERNELIENEKIKAEKPQVDYLIAISDKEENQEDEIVIFCVDTSGSMCTTYEIQGTKEDFQKIKKTQKQNIPNFADDSFQQIQRLPQNQMYISRLDCLKIAIQSQIESFYRDSPNKRVGLVSFSNIVKIHEDTRNPTKTLEKDTLLNIEEIKNSVSKRNIPAIKETKRLLQSNLQNLEDNGQTALGPALVVSAELAGKKEGSRVILCTDGKSNIGIGNVDDDDELNKRDDAKENMESFYTQLALECKNKGIMISVMTFDDTDCNLEQISKVVQETEGDMDIVKPTQIQDTFKEFLSAKIVATQVRIKIIIHKNMFIYDSAENQNAKKMDENDERVSSHYEERGNVSNDESITFNYDFRDDSPETQKVFVQFQIEYKLLDGTIRKRILTQALDVTENEDKAQEDIDLDIINANVTERSSEAALHNDHQRALDLTKQGQALGQNAFRFVRNEEQRNRYHTSNMAYLPVQNMMMDQLNEDIQEMQDLSSGRRSKTKSKDKSVNAYFNAKKFSKHEKKRK